MPIRTILALLIALAFHAEAGDPAETFAADCAAKVSALLHKAATINPETGVEDKAKRKAVRARQDRLEAWFEAKGRNVSTKNCKTAEDLKNLHDFPNEMANYKFLKLSVGERKKFIKKVDAYFAVFSKRFEPSLDQLVKNKKLKAFLQKRCETRLTFKLRFFGKVNGKGITAMYLPKTATMLINLDQMTGKPEAFFDNFEHELWHHLLPPNVDAIAEGLWFEGLNEALSEHWAAKLRKGNRRDQSVEYPVATAWGSLLIDQAPEATMAYMAGLKSRDELSKALAAKGPLGKLLAQELKASLQIEAEEKKQLEKTLTSWGWKEDDKSPIDLTRYLTDGELSNQALKKDFLNQKDFLNDLIQAKTIVHLQRLKKGVSAKQIGRMPESPEHLRKNLKLVLRYIDEPIRQYRYWTE